MNKNNNIAESMHFLKESVTPKKSIHPKWDKYIIEVYNRETQGEDFKTIEEVYVQDLKYMFLRFLINPNPTLKYIFDYLSVKGAAAVKYMFDDFLANNLMEIYYKEKPIKETTFKIELYRQLSKLDRIRIIEVRILPIKEKKNVQMFIAPFCTNLQIKEAMRYYETQRLLHRDLTIEDQITDRMDYTKGVQTKWEEEKEQAEKEKEEAKKQAEEDRKDEIPNYHEFYNLATKDNKPLFCKTHNETYPDNYYRCRYCAEGDKIKNREKVIKRIEADKIKKEEDKKRKLAREERLKK
jgi:DNA-directed RNA polymerase subunit RPC12/RpoP